MREAAVDAEAPGNVNGAEHEAVEKQARIVQPELDLIEQTQTDHQRQTEQPGPQPFFAEIHRVPPFVCARADSTESIIQGFGRFVYHPKV